MNPLKFDYYFQFFLLIFIADIFLNFNTGILKKGYLINNRLRLAAIYLKKNFILDFLAIIPLIIDYFRIIINVDILHSE